MNNLHITHRYNGVNGKAEFFLDKDTPFLVLYNTGSSVCSTINQAMQELVNHVQAKTANDLANEMKTAIATLGLSRHASDLGSNETVYTSVDMETEVDQRYLVIVPKNTYYTFRPTSINRISRGLVMEFESDTKLWVETTFDNQCYAQLEDGSEIVIYLSVKQMQVLMHPASI